MYGVAANASHNNSVSVDLFWLLILPAYHIEVDYFTSMEIYVYDVAVIVSHNDSVSADLSWLLLLPAYHIDVYYFTSMVMKCMV